MIPHLSIRLSISVVRFVSVLIRIKTKESKVAMILWYVMIYIIAS